MNHFTAISLNTKPAPETGKKVKRIPLTEEQFAFVLGVDPNKKQKTKASAPRKNAAAAKVEAVLLQLKCMSEPVAATTLARAVGFSPETARVCCAQLVDDGIVTQISGSKCYWKIRGEGDPAIIRVERKPLIVRKPRTYAPHKSDAGIYAAVTCSPKTSGEISRRMPGNPDAKSIWSRLRAMSDAGFLQQVETACVLTWARTAKPLPQAAEPEPEKPRFVAGIAVATVTARNGDKVSLPKLEGFEL